MSQSSIIQQYVYETHNWQRLLAFFIKENVSFKTRLAQLVDSIPVVDSISGKEDLEIIEEFHEKFLSHDRTVSFLSDELQQQKKILEKCLHEKDELFEEVVNHQNELRKKIKKTEEIFFEIKEEFGAYLIGKFNCFLLF